MKDRLSLIISLKIAQMTSIRQGHVNTYVASVRWRDGELGMGMGMVMVMVVRL